MDVYRKYTVKNGLVGLYFYFHVSYVLSRISTHIEMYYIFNERWVSQADYYLFPISLLVTFSFLI